MSCLRDTVIIDEDKKEIYTKPQWVEKTRNQQTKQGFGLIMQKSS